MYFNKLNKITKQELKIAEKERKRCQKLYPDWKDDAYNCGPLKHIWGIKSSDDLSESECNFYTLNDLDITYNRDTKKYLLGIETIYSFTSINERISYLNYLLDAFKEYLKSQFDSGFDPFFLCHYNNGELFMADSITELYYKFKIFVKGYEQLWQQIKLRM